MNFVGTYIIELVEGLVVLAIITGALHWWFKGGKNGTSV